MPPGCRGRGPARRDLPAPLRGAAAGARRRPAARPGRLAGARGASGPPGRADVPSVPSTHPLSPQHTLCPLKTQRASRPAWWRRSDRRIRPLGSGRERV
ncbi:hypothetical protein ELQ87_03675 [Streptomyces griseoviridis]|uniref:Uncharacterized protein n=1 Tax=Streptomyces griseoviridis TaxID=45398 RepID=A0A3S9Z726_STRGD|nr:hypothetical protein ELQ87_03675 [Streptomyces griseoviridis]QCN89659.1 hypothetical protein DDJ31_35680 [Streptomyces griseoviridis]